MEPHKVGKQNPQNRDLDTKLSHMLEEKNSLEGLHISIIHVYMFNLITH